MYVHFDKGTLKRCHLILYQYNVPTKVVLKSLHDMMFVYTSLMQYFMDL